MPNLAQDARSMMLDFGEPVTLASGTQVFGVPSMASVEDALAGTGSIAGVTNVLRFATVDVPGLAPTTSTLTWRGQLWGVNHIQFAGAGQITRAFLGTP